MREIKYLAIEKEVDGESIAYHNKIKTLELFGKHSNIFEKNENKGK